MPDATTEKPPAQDDQPFADTPAGWAQRWKKELEAASKALEAWKQDCAVVRERFLNQKSNELLNTGGGTADQRWGLFTANIQQQRALLFGQTPQVEVSRRFDDAEDDVARVGGDMLDRILNQDLQAGGDGTLRAMKHALDDFRLYDFGVVRVRYEVDTAKEGEAERTTDERVLTDWVHRDRFLWSAGARTWEEVRWVAFGTEQSRRTLVERFPESGPLVPLNSKRSEGAPAQSKESDDKPADPWQRALIWEIWDKETGRVFWYSADMPVTLDDKPDPLKLKGYWPCPRPMLFNATTDAYLPRPDYMLAEGLYNKLDSLLARIRGLEQAVKVRGVYDGTNEPVKRLLSEAGGNELVPVDNWPRFGEAGGLKGLMDFLPLDMIVQALAALREEAAATKMDLYEVTGWSDIVRGQGVRDGVTATESRTEANFASVRMRAIQDEFARFCSDIQRLRAECICSKFDAERLIERSNVLNTEDAPLAQDAAAFLKDEAARDLRIEVRPEAVSMADFTAQKAERLEVMDALTKFVQGMQPLAVAVPGSSAYMLRLMQWALSGLRGARGAEAILDPAIAEAEKAIKAMAANPQPAQEDPKLAAQRMKMQGDQQKTEMDIHRMERKAQLDVAAEAQKQQIQTEANIREQTMIAGIKARTAAQADARRGALGAPRQAPKGGG